MFLKTAVNNYDSAFKYSSTPAPDGFELIAGKIKSVFISPSTWRLTKGNPVTPGFTTGLGTVIKPKADPNFPGIVYQDAPPIVSTALTGLGDIFSDIKGVIGGVRDISGAIPDAQKGIQQLETAIKVIMVLSGIAAVTGVVGLFRHR